MKPLIITFPPLLLRRFMYRILHKYILRNFSPVALFLLLRLLILFWRLFFWLVSLGTRSHTNW